MTNLTTVSPTSKLPASDPGRLAAAPATGCLAGCIRPAATLTPVERDRMYALLAAHFANVTPAHFERDLAEKEDVILLADTGSGLIEGFSTLMRLQTVVDGRPVVAFFSGDTIIAPAYWGQAELSRLWSRHVFSLAEEVTGARVYWFLISSGYKTYRFLPVFFQEFYPTYRRPTPPEVQRVLDALATLKFPAGYDAGRGVICMAQAAPLRPGVAEVTPQRLKDPHVAFFVAANPGHAHGDELACLTEISRANLTPAGRRMLLGAG